MNDASSTTIPSPSTPPQPRLLTFFDTPPSWPTACTRQASIKTTIEAACRLHTERHPAAHYRNDPHASPRWLAWIEHPAPGHYLYKLGTLCGCQFLARANDPLTFIDPCR